MQLYLLCRTLIPRTPDAHQGGLLYSQYMPPDVGYAEVCMQTIEQGSHGPRVLRPARAWTTLAVSVHGLRVPQCGPSAGDGVPKVRAALTSSAMPNPIAMQQRDTTILWMQQQ